MGKNLVSVIVPVYNTEKYLKECLDSIVNQTYKNIEIIIINDGSTDNSLKICEEYKAKDERIKIYNRTNHGIAITRNYGIKKATGELIMFCDSDDYYDISMIQKMVDIQSKYNVDIVRCEMNSDFVKDCTKDLHNKVIKIDKNLIERFITRNNNIGCYLSVLLMKKKCTEEIDERLSYLEDTYFAVRLLINSKTCYFIDDKLYTYRSNPCSITKNSSNSIRNINSALTCHKLLDEILKKSNIYSEKLKYDKNTLLVELIYYKLDLITKDYYKNNRNIIIDTLKNDYLVFVFKCSNSKKLNKQIRIVRFLVNHKMYGLVFRFIWFKDFVKKIIKK